MATSVLKSINALAGDALKRQGATNERGRILDSSWVRQAFIVSNKAGSNGGKSLSLDPVDAANRYYSSAFFKYTDSTVGGNFCINPPPQFTPYADPPVKGLSRQAIEQGVTYSAGITGMGRYYSEAIDDNNHNIHLCFGFPSYNSLTQFFTGFYNDSAATLARTGRVDKGFFDKFIKVAFTLISIAILPLTIIPIIFMAAGNAIRFFLNMPASKFYYFKEGMPVYWQVVNTMVNQLAVNKGLVTYTQPDVFESFIGEKPRLDNAKKTIFHQIFPEMAADGIIDVYAISSRAKRLEARHRKEVYKQLLQGGDSSWYGKVKKVLDEGGGIEQPDAKESKPFTQKTFFEKWLAGDSLGMGDKEGAIETDIRVNKDSLGASGKQALSDLQTSKYKPNLTDSVWDYFMANVADGSKYATFRVDNVDPMTESFSNSTGPSALAEKLNSTSQSAREIRVSYAEGNVESSGVVGQVLSGAASILTNAADLIHLGGLASFAGRAFVDIPEHWTAHTAQLPQQSYTITLASPYGNVVSQMLHIYIPLCMLLSGALPLATGKQSYTSPFLCQLYDRGRSITRLGLINSLTITRGTSNLAWDNQGTPMAIEVSFTVKDLSSVIALPIHEGISVMPLDGVFDTETAYTDYLMVLAGISVQEATDRLPILKRQLDSKWSELKSYTSMSRITQQLASTAPGQLLSALMAGSDKK